MDADLLLPLISRWLHVLTAIVLVGGTIFMRFVLMPSATVLSEGEHNALREQLLSRWKKFVHAGIGLLLLTGFYNYLVVMRPSHGGDGLYHGVMGTKIILALVVFMIASGLVGRSAAFEPLRQNRKRWLAVLVAMTVIIVLMSGLLKVRGVPNKSHIDVKIKINDSE
ncbi:MAG: hypothetical protein O2955_00835 [Planctomycetota bacterium]|nr:hypothetical protein [Planctomycetota bacterium]MDA1211027.1 hypothetical protein [Planctomycetota bacterium]